GYTWHSQFTVCRYLSSPRKMQVWQRYYIPDMSVAKVDDSIEKALQVWAKVTPLRFRRIYSSIADIMISFSRSHGDGSPLDGPDGNLPHAFGQALGIGGDAHIDDDETFTFHSNTGDSVTLFLITAQDAGRSLGLSHSDDPGALMYSVYSYSNLDTFVLPWDLKGIKSLYTRRLRLDPGFGLRGEMLFFKGRKVKQIHLVTPQQAVITNFWPDASVIIDAAYETRCCVWAFSGYDLMTGYPKSIPSFGLPTAVEKDTLFFVGSSYYSCDEARVDMDDGNPKQVDDTFLEMSSGVTAALLYRGEHLSSCFQGLWAVMQNKQVTCNEKGESWFVKMLQPQWCGTGLAFVRQIHNKALFLVAHASGPSLLPCCLENTAHLKSVL
uniref:Peptidase metallopeptidase domain-containing protein n=1 Tax=Pundamilia nyererei TaxID=303518 RepID=A0A3B4EZG0_9CICH